MNDETTEVEVEVEEVPEGHVFRDVLDVRLLTKVPTVHQMVAYERARAVLYSRHVKIRATVSEPAEQYRQLLPIALDMDSKALAFAESMLPDEDQRRMVDEWLITDQILPSDLVKKLLGRDTDEDPDDDADPKPTKAKPVKAARPAKAARKTANAKRLQR